MLPKGKKYYKAAIIGAGRIASGFDDPKSRAILTHAHAYRENSKTRLAAVMDIDPKKAKDAARKWSTKYFTNLETMFRYVQPDIVSITTPDENHFATLARVISYRPRLIICEKPLVKTLPQAAKILRLAKKEKIPILVNYPRRFEKYVQKIRAEIRSKAYGAVIGAFGIYAKGILHNGSHMIDLCRYLFGELVSSSIRYRQYDYRRDDPTLGGFVTFERCPQFYLMSGDERRYSIFELTIFTGKKRFTLVDEGFRLITQTVASDPLFKGYRILGPPHMINTELTTALAGTIQNAVDFLDGKAPLLCDAAEAVKTLKTCALLLKK